MQIWRISNHADLSGRGGTMGDGRWHRKGVHITYCADHPSTALLEILVHATRVTVPDVYQLIEIDVPDDVSISDANLPAGWERNLGISQKVGMEFLASGEAALLRVPSVIMPKASNLLINPQHRASTRISIVETYRYPFDSRLLR